MSISRSSERAMTLPEIGTGHIFGLTIISQQRAMQSGCKSRFATDMATTSNGAILLSGHIVERETVQTAIRRNKWGQFGENLGRVEIPWCGLAYRRLMIP